MDKSNKNELFEKETKYCKIIRSVTVEDKDETFAIERIFIKALQREEIRFCLYKDCIDRKNKLIPRPIDISADKLIILILMGIKAGVLNSEFKKELISALS